jgi:hypothetical protein
VVDDHSFSLDEVVAALDFVTSGAAIGRVVVTV